MIESIPTQWEIIVVDGRWTGNKAPDKFSSKDLRDKVESYKNVTLIEYSGMEFEARNKYFEASSSFDILILIDSDEWISNFNEEIFYNYISHLTEGKHKIESPQSNSFIPRLFINPYRWRYYKSHKFLKFDDGAIENISHGVSVVNGIEISTDDKLRPAELAKYIEEYQKQLWKYETEQGIDRLA